jgi:purine-binding chemotaxis protein CheW
MKGEKAVRGLLGNAWAEDEGTTSADRDEALRRLETINAAIERKLTPSTEEKRQILKMRAKALAREPKRHEADDQYLEVVEFLLAYETYAIESRYVREVYPLKEITPQPCTPPFVLGMISVRGKILWIIDIKKFFELPDKGLTDLNKVIIIHTDDIELGILADSILGIRSIPLQEIQPSLPTLTGIRAEYLRGVTNDRRVILDGEKILSDRRIIAQER